MKQAGEKLKNFFLAQRENNYRPKFLAGSFLWWYILVLLLLKLTFLSLLICFPKVFFFADISRALLIKLANEERTKLGLPILRENPLLNQAAQLKAQDIIGDDYFSHYAPDGTSPWYWFGKAGYDYAAAGENLGIGFLDSEEIHQAWDNSPSHRANLLNPDYQDIGIAVLTGQFKESHTAVVVQLFGKPRFSETEQIEAAAKAQGVENKEEPQMILPDQEPKEALKRTGDLKPAVLPLPQVSPGATYLYNSKTQEQPGFLFKIFQFLMEDYSALVQKIILYSLILVIVGLFSAIFVNFRYKHPDLILRGVLFAFLLGSFLFLDKDLFLEIIPHSLAIY